MSALNPPADADQQPNARAHASVLVRSATGQPLKRAGTSITPENVKSFLPAPDALTAAANRLRDLGFAIDLVAPTHLNISGAPALYEQVFQTRLIQRTYPLFNPPESGPRQVRFEAARPLVVPASLSDLVESVELEPPVLLHLSATPPGLAYDHLEVPDDVARGMDAIKAHQRGITGLGIALAAVDTGFMTPQHPYFAGRGYRIHPVNARSDDLAPGDDSNGHGTGVSACALAVAPDVEYTPVKGIVVSATEAFSRAVMAAPRIITNSWSLNAGFSTALQLAINNAVADGIVVLFATGNRGPVAWPGSEPAVISVGGVFLAEDDSLRASNYASSGVNANNPGRQCPDVCGLVGMAPEGIYIALPTQPGSTVDGERGGRSFPAGDETAANDGWVGASGTSSATPMVAGVVALMMQADPTLIGNPAAVRARLVTSCIDVTTGMSASGQLAGPGVDTATGAGLVQAYRAVHATDLWMRDNPDSDRGLVPTTARRPAYPPFTHWTSPDIKVVAGPLADPEADFDSAAEVSPIFDQDNFVYVRVRNRGTQDAGNVSVRLYYADPSTSLAFPGDWRDGGSGVPSEGSLQVRGMVSSEQLLPTVVADGAAVTPEPFVWRPPDPSTATQSQRLPDGRVVGHFCLLAWATGADDPVIFTGAGEASIVRDNNLAMKNQQVYSARVGAKHLFHFFVRGARTRKPAREFTLVGDVGGLPDGTEIALDIPDKQLSVRHTVKHSRASWRGNPSCQPLPLAIVVLDPAEEALARILLRLPRATPPGRYRFPLGQQSGAGVIGGVNLVAELV